MLRVFSIFFVLAVIMVVSLAGFRGQKSPKPPIEIFPDMDRQPRFDPQHESQFFSDSRAQRPPVPGTVPIGYTVPHLYYTVSANNNKLAQKPGGFTGASDYYDSGRIGDTYGDGIPLNVTREFIERGRERFTINCAICHGATATGNGIVGQFGLVAIANLQDKKIQTMPDGQIFNRITYGYNTMGAYGSNVTVEDRWAIIAYIRALQRSQNATLADVPQDQRAQLDQASAPAPAPAAQPQPQAPK